MLPTIAIQTYFYRMRIGQGVQSESTSEFAIGEVSLFNGEREKAATGLERFMTMNQ